MFTKLTNITIVQTSVYLFEQGFRSIKRDGFIDAFLKSTKYILPIRWIYAQIVKYRHGDSAPKHDKILWIDPQKIQFVYPSSERNFSLPIFGIIKGDWDLKKAELGNSWVTIGLRERFADGYDWEDTMYYEVARDKINSGQYVTVMDRYPSTMEGLRNHLLDIDRLYQRMDANGFISPKKLHTYEMPRMHIGRHGEIILTHGHHRTVIAQILDIEAIPLIVSVRHWDWQKVRERVHDTNDVNRFDDSINKYLDHPDIQDLLE